MVKKKTGKQRKTGRPKVRISGSCLIALGGLSSASLLPGHSH